MSRVHPTTRRRRGHLWVVPLVALLSCSGDGQIAAIDAPVAPLSAAGPSEPSAGIDRPTRIRIPAIDVDAPIVPLGIDEQGELETPTDPDDAGWFTGGAEPGEVGRTVIAGHVDSYDGPAVFRYLRDLEPGDEIVVSGDEGAPVVFVVDSVGQYSKRNFPTRDVYGRSAVPALRLITCGGGFDRDEMSYSDNIVVFAWEANAV